MYQPSVRNVPNLAFLYLAFAAASTSQMAALVARLFADFSIGAAAPPAGEPTWATPNTVTLKLRTVRLRDFTTDAEGLPALLCAPFALHGAAMVDFAPGHSLVAALRGAGLRRLFVTDWRSASPEMRFLGIDEYLADLNVLVDKIGPPVILAGLCQGGWMALIYAARFPGKVRKLVLAGAPIDIAAARSAVSVLAENTPLAFFRELVRLGDGLVIGRKVQKFWGPETVTSSDMQQILDSEERAGSAAFNHLEAAFRNWYAWTVDLPGALFLETVDKIYQHNELAAGRFVALGEPISLSTVKVPLFLLAARDDELVAPAQLFAAKDLVGTSAPNIVTAVAPCRHAGLFMSKRTLNEIWPSIVRWLRGPAVHSSEAPRGSRDPLYA